MKFHKKYLELYLHKNAIKEELKIEFPLFSIKINSSGVAI